MGRVNPVLQALFREPLRDLGADDPRLRGILAPVSERGAARTGVTAQFLENAAEYHARYGGNVEWFRRLIGDALGPDDGTVRVVLDVGSGSGNSVIPLLELYPDAFVVATDISPQLLAILRELLEARPAYRGRYGLVSMDANHDRYRCGAFDLAVGAAILHHIVDPRRVLGACASALRPGGRALFIEPFEPGHGVLRVAYRRILAEAKRRGERGPGFEMLRRMVVDQEARLRDKSDPIFATLDDKWYFTRSWFEAATRGPEWEECRVSAINGIDTPLVDEARTELRLGLGADESALPKWAWETIREHQAGFSREAWHDLILEGTIVLRRSALAAGGEADTPRHGWWWNRAESGRGFFVEIGPLRAACCVYGDDGEPRWCAVGSEALRADARSLELRVEGTVLRLEPQHADTPVVDARTGWWIEDTPRPSASIVVECLGERLMAALLGPEEWTLMIGIRRDAQRYDGDWLRFTGGQALGQAYRAPNPPRVLGPGRLSWADEECLVALLPDGRRGIYRRLGADESAPQNFRSTEKCAS